MAKEPFTAAGVDDKRIAIFAMSTINREAEAVAVETDCVQWVKDNFTLSNPQETYLSAIDGNVIKYWGSLLALCFRNLLDFTLVFPPPPPGYAGGKWVEEANSVKCGVDGTGDFEVSGDVTFTVVYK